MRFTFPGVLFQNLTLQMPNRAACSTHSTVAEKQQNKQGSNANMPETIAMWGAWDTVACTWGGPSPGLLCNRPPSNPGPRHGSDGYAHAPTPELDVEDRRLREVRHALQC